MLKHIFHLIFRNFLRFKSVFFINLIGLSTGIACALLIYLWVSDEWNTDRFHANDGRLVQVMENHIDAGAIRTQDGTAGLLAETMIKDLPEVEMSSPVAPAIWFDNFTLVDDDANLTRGNGQFAGKQFLEMFSYPMVVGTAENALGGTDNIVLSEELATRMFGSPEKAMGESVEWQLLSFRRNALVSGVYRTPDAPSSANFDFLLSFEAFKEINPSVTDWGNSGPYTYLLLKPNTDKAAFSGKIKDYLETMDPELTYRDLFIRNYSDAYLYGDYDNGYNAGGRIEYVRLFTLIAVFILLIACINFMNLSTAKASRRIREVGIKKAVGASRRILIIQYLTESVLMATISLLLAMGLVSILLPYFNDITGKQLVMGFDLRVIAGFVLIALLTGVIAGSYPAFYLSGFNPALVLKGKISKSTGELWARKGLVVFQFVMSAMLIVAVFIVERQIRFIQEENMGFDRENVISFPYEGKMTANPENFMDQLKRQPGVLNAAYLQQTFVANQSSTIGLYWEGKDPDTQVPFQNFSASPGIVKTLGLTILEGRDYYENPERDTGSLLINESAVRVMELEDPVGTTVNLWGNDVQIIGVVKDFHYMSLHEPVRPAFIKPVGSFAMNVTVRLSGKNIRETLEALTVFYETYNDGYEFDYTFLDQNFEQLYTSELRVASLSRYFAVLAIMISCLGLFGLATFTAERRSKEIGIRKILGSSSTRIMLLLSGEFSKMVLIAILIAMPLSYILAGLWLENFTRRMDLNWTYFVLAGILALVISWLSVGFQTWKAARTNPVNSLRNE